VSQSAWILAALLGGFVLYVAAKGRLQTYASVLWGPTAAPAPTVTSGGGSGSVFQQAGSIAMHLGEAYVTGGLGG